MEQLIEPPQVIKCIKTVKKQYRGLIKQILPHNKKITCPMEWWHEILSELQTIKLSENSMTWSHQMFHILKTMKWMKDFTVVKNPDNSQSLELTIDGPTDKIEHYQWHVKLRFAWPRRYLPESVPSRGISTSGRFMATSASSGRISK